MDADFVIPAGGSSLAFAVFDNFSHGHVINGVEKLNTIQKTFVNSHAIFVRPNPDAFMMLQTSMNSGKVTMLLANDIDEAVSAIFDIYTKASDTRKKEIQLDYFKKTDNTLTGPSTAREIANTLLCSQLSIPENECSLLLDTCSLRNLMAIDQSAIMESCPVEAESAQMLSDFFSASSFFS
uniref:Uncharacterized protein n=1 Tax=Fibrocapsa japonica TaxID=94617 RepID=A0A7S2V769_9STRA